ncbi:MAG: hypothetical protein R3183_12755 [Oleiphilaceae bacterium]|nr:hypothetical protein [Oleiphilaceae bacterium]
MHFLANPREQTIVQVYGPTSLELSNAEVSAIRNLDRQLSYLSRSGVEVRVLVDDVSGGWQVHRDHGVVEISIAAELSAPTRAQIRAAFLPEQGS